MTVSEAGFVLAWGQIFDLVGDYFPTRPFSIFPVPRFTVKWRDTAEQTLAGRNPYMQKPYISQVVMTFYNIRVVKYFSALK